jgi:hypothetical protein
MYARMRMCARINPYYPSSPSKLLNLTIPSSITGGFPPIATDKDRDKMEGRQGSGLPPLEGAMVPAGGWTFDAVQERLVEAMIICWRNPDRERGWQQLRSAWPEVLRELSAGDYDARGGDLSSSDVSIRPASLTRAEVGEMEEAFGWLDAVPPHDRKLVGLAIVELARGRREVSWLRLLRAMGLTRGSDGLRMRYGRAIAGIAARLNGGNPQASASRG